MVHDGCNNVITIIAGRQNDIIIPGGLKKAVPLFKCCNNFRKCAPILTIFSLIEQKIYDA